MFSFNVNMLTKLSKVKIRCPPNAVHPILVVSVDMPGTDSTSCVSGVIILVVIMTQIYSNI